MVRGCGRNHFEIYGLVAGVGLSFEGVEFEGRKVGFELFEVGHLGQGRERVPTILGCFSRLDLLRALTLLQIHDGLLALYLRNLTIVVAVDRREVVIDTFDNISSVLLISTLLEATDFHCTS